MKPVLLANLYDLKKGHKPIDISPQNFNGGIRFIQIQDLRSNNSIQYASSRGTEVNPDDICIAWDGANAGTVGYGLRGLIGSTLVRLRNNGKYEVYPPYMGRFLQSKFAYLNHSTFGAAIPHVSKDKLLGLNVLLPNLSEQKRIVGILDKADAICQKRQQAIALLDDLLRATFLNMFSDVEAKEWKISNVQNMALSEKGAIRTGPFGSQLLHSEFVEHGIAVLGIDNAVKNRFIWGQARYITPEKYSQLRRYTVKPGDVLITIMGTCGRCAVVPNDCPTAINTKHLCCITLDWERCLPSFLHAYFLMHPIARKYLQQKAKGAIMDGLNMGVIQELPVPEAPLSLQKNFDQISQKIYQQKAASEKMLADQTTLFESLVQRAFNGGL